MTYTADHDCSAQSQHFNGADAPYRQHTRIKRPVSSGPITVDLTGFATNVQRMMKHVEQSSAVATLNSILKSSAAFQLKQTLDSEFEHIQKPLAELIAFRQNLARQISDVIIIK